MLGNKHVALSVFFFFFQCPLLCSFVGSWVMLGEVLDL